MEDNGKTIPRHVAIILDGNGRYAKAHGLPRRLGHKAGCDNLETLVEDAADLGIEIAVAEPPADFEKPERKKAEAAE